MPSFEEESFSTPSAFSLGDSPIKPPPGDLTFWIVYGGEITPNLQRHEGPVDKKAAVNFSNGGGIFPLNLPLNAELLPSPQSCSFRVSHS